MDRVGFRALDFTSSTHMAVSVRFHHEDPWERIRRVSEAMPETPLNFITTGMRFISWVPAGEDVIRLVFRCVARNGIRRFQIAEPSNDPDALIRLARMAREEGVEEVVVGLTYSISPVHTHEYYLERARAVAASRAHRPPLPQGPRRAAHRRRRPRADPGLHRSGRAASGRAAQPLHDQPRSARLHGGARGRDPHPPHRGCPGRQRDLQPVLRDDPAQPGGGGLLPRPRHRCPGRGLRALPRARRGEGPAARRPGRVRRRLLPPPDARRDGDDHQAPAAGDRQARALRRHPRGGDPRPRRDGLSDHGHPGLAVRRHPGGDERDLRRSAGARSPTRWSATSTATSSSPPRRSTREIADKVLSRRAPRSSASSSRSAWRERASASARGSPRRSCCCA